MNWKYKKTFFVFLSLVLGGIVIFGAAKMGKVFPASDEPKSEEWKSNLSVIPGDDSIARVTKGQIDEKASMATTTTDLIARRLVLEYMLTQKKSATSTMSETDITNIAHILASEVKLPEKREYKLSDLNISKDNSADAKLAYRNAFAALAIEHAESEKKENELTILVTAMETKDATVLVKLKGKADFYQQFVNKILAMKTPSSAAPIHLHFLQTYETLRVATVGLQSMLVDPVIGNAALAEYKNGLNELPAVGKDYHNYFLK